MSTHRKLVLAALVVGLAALSIRLSGPSRRGSAGAAPGGAPASAAYVADTSGAPLRESTAPIPITSTTPIAEPGARSAVPSPAETTGLVVLGTVVDEDARPLAGARVWLFPRTIEGSGAERERGSFVPEASLVTGADGRFGFAVASDARRVVLVDAPSYAPKWRNQEPGVDAPFELEPGARVLGSVAGARVWARGSGWDGASLVLADGPERVDDGRGSYAVRGIEVGEGCVLEVVPDTGLSFYESVVVNHAGDVRHDIVLETHWIEGLVEDAVSGVPVVGAIFSAETPEGRRVVAESGLGGRFRLPVQRGDAPMESASLAWPLSQVDVDTPGYLSLVQFPVLALVGSSDPRVRLVPAGRIIGRVVLDGGLPAAGATISCEEGLLVLEDLGVRSSPRSRETRCDDDGRFVLREVLWGVHDMALDVRLGDLQRRVLGVAPLGPGETRELEIRLGSAAVVQGVVRWNGMSFYPGRSLDSGLSAFDGAPPVPTAQVTLASQEGSLVRETETDACGAFAFDAVSPGTYAVSATGGPDARSFPELVVVGVEPTTALVLRLDAPQVQLAGRVLLPSGAPFARQSIDVLPRGTDARSDLWWYGSHRGRTNEEGGFRLQIGVFPGTRSVLGVSHAGATLVLEVPRSLTTPFEPRQLSEEEAKLVLESVRAVRARDIRTDGTSAGARGPIEWRLPVIVPVRLRFPGGVGPESAVLSWSGPGPGESGRPDRRLERDANGLYPTVLPAGVVDLELVFDGERISVSGVLVPSEPVEGGVLIEL